jgi:methylenetetrahydrofolate dehydrogenase (NADP+)/methenyltetrahydrofolate cyclohydrolase
VVRRLRAEISAAGEPRVCLATVLVSDDPRDFSNARRKHVAATEAGMQFHHTQLAAGTSQAGVERAIHRLAVRPEISGIFIQLPLPKRLNAIRILDHIPPKRNIDSRDAPATPRGIVNLLAHNDIRVAQKACVIVGRSTDIGLPLAELLERERASSVRAVDPDAPDLVSITREAEILVSCAERPDSITRAHVRSGAIVVDAGYIRGAQGVTGDVDAAGIEGVAAALVPMPGGIGPATIAILLERTWANAV